MFSSTFLAMFTDWGILALRLALGAIFLAHGWPKIKDLRRTGDNFAAMGFHPGALWGSVAAVVEFFGGIALLLGFFTQVAAMFFVGEFIVIVVWRTLRKQPFVGGSELDALILAAALVLLTIGGGAYSLDRYLFLTGH